LQEEIEAKLSSKQDQVVQLQNEMSQLKYEVDKKDELIRSHDIALERLKLEIKKRDHRKEMSLQVCRPALVLHLLCAPLKTEHR